ncbi:hypothetical protein V496_06769 [Pseudogymnoascus sp. VKM F-4515 (FW-2607)]|nr:hypothetical protein V496_06769 [Pseudogymnoascus sp. VKM F-4515 (FW-2607)]KFY83523.1 hypothetical protein V498_08008 [Pseudogymnoascus sp. VKM F-4517 (FW-2822)]
MSHPTVPRATSGVIDPAATVSSTSRNEPVAVGDDQDSRSRESYEKTERDERDTDFEKAESRDSDAGFEKTKSAPEAKPIGEPLAPYATSASGASAATTVPTVAAKKPWYKTPNPMKWGAIPAVPSEREVSREATAGWFSLLTFQWMAPVMTAGYKRPLDQNDIWLVNPKRKAAPMTERMQASFKRRAERGDKYPLLWAMHETFKWEFWIGGFCQFFANLFTVFAPFTLRFLIQFATDAYVAQQTGAPAPNIGKGVGLVVGVTAMQAMKISGRAKAGGRALDEDSEGVGKPGDGKDMKTGEKGEKEEKGEKGEKGKDEQAPGVSGDGTGWGNGRIVNLMAVDTYRVDQASAMFHLIWTAPIACLLTLALLIINLRESALAGFALLVLGIPALTMAVKSLFTRRRAINKITDQRVSLTQEILQAVRFVKYFGWEMAFLDRLRSIRDREIYAIQILLAIRNAINAVSMSMPIFASMLAFITYSLTDNTLEPAKVFSSLALFNSLRMPLNLLPLVIGQVVDAWSSLKRIQEFLLCEEQPEEAVWDMEGKNAVEINNASFTWERTVTQEAEDVKGKPAAKPAAKTTKSKKPTAGDSNPSPSEASSGALTPDSASTSAPAPPEPFKLHDLDIKLGRNELVAVIGGVGSGKSSLLAALAGDMRKTSGDVVFGATRAFCPQYAWIQNASVRENIVFGKEMARGWYDKVIDACALRPDLEMLPSGDGTEIGERGITVSGGQKQRINIARAIYFDADIVIMDDPLSAVDAHVGRHIFDNAICGLLKDKCRVLATHQLWVLNRCDRIIWLEEGRVQAVDTFENLMANDAGFQHLMETTAVEEKEEKKEEEEEEEVVGEAKDKKKKKKKDVGLMQAEERQVKSVPWSVYASYIKASGSMWSLFVVLLFLVLSNGANIVTSLWLSWWTSDKFGFTSGVYIGVYAGLGVSQALLMFSFAVSLTVFGTTSSKVMLNRAITRTLRAPMSFFDTTPLGRITNRFSRDVDTMDNFLTDAIRMYFLTIGMIIATFALIIAYFHYFTIALVPLSFIFVFSAGYYRASAREMKRFESVFRSSLFAKFSEGLSGSASIRAYGLQDRFVTSIRTAIDEMNSAYYLTFSNQRWLSIRLDAIGNLLVFTTGILVITSRFDVNPSIGGLVLSYILAIVQILQFTVRQLAEVENGMNSTERVHFYGTELEEEAPLHTIEVADSWPQAGEIVFKDVEMRYRPNLPLVLSGLNMHVSGGERIGVVGRTGAGKSSIMSALFRLVEISAGSITIDGVNISTIGLHDLRSRLAIIPQDPTLFKGTVRSNLDPFNEHTDLELWSALRQSDLVSADAQLDDKAPGRIHLDGVVEEEGLNFSLGQRQLMALARALVRGSRIIVCDEATSSVDMETDDKIQRTMAAGFKGKTLLCIAHRLKTIIGYDRICVMDKGSIAELDTPLKLYEAGGIFRGMCDRSGIRREDFGEVEGKE